MLHCENKSKGEMEELNRLTKVLKTKLEDVPKHANELGNDMKKVHQIFPSMLVERGQPLRFGMDELKDILVLTELYAKEIQGLVSYYSALDLEGWMTLCTFFKSTMKDKSEQLSAFEKIIVKIETKRVKENFKCEINEILFFLELLQSCQEFLNLCNKHYDHILKHKDVNFARHHFTIVCGQAKMIDKLCSSYIACVGNATSNLDKIPLQDLDNSLTALEINLVDMPSRAVIFTRDMMAIEVAFIQLGNTLEYDTEEFKKYVKECHTIKHQNQNDAITFRWETLPNAEDFVQRVVYNMSHYTSLDFEEWKEITGELHEVTSSFLAECLELRKNAKNNMTALKKRSNASVLLYKNIFQFCHNQEPSNNSNSTQVNLINASGQALKDFDQLGTNLQKRDTITAVECLICAIDSFSTLLNSFVQYFLQSESQLDIIGRHKSKSSKENSDGVHYAHYNLVRQHAMKIETLCAGFIGSVGQVQASLDSLPSVANGRLIAP